MDGTFWSEVKTTENYSTSKHQYSGVRKYQETSRDWVFWTVRRPTVLIWAFGEKTGGEGIFKGVGGEGLPRGSDFRGPVRIRYSRGECVGIASWVRGCFEYYTITENTSIEKRTSRGFRKLGCRGMLVKYVNVDHVDGRVFFELMSYTDSYDRPESLSPRWPGPNQRQEVFPVLSFEPRGKPKFNV